MIYYIYIGTAAIIVFMYVQYYLNSRKHKAETQNYSVDSEYKNAEKIKEDLLSTELIAIKKQMNGTPVDAITECLYITDLKTQIAGAAITVAKKALWRTVGVRAKYYDEVPNVSYAILSGDSFHYIHFQEEKIMEHLIFDKYRMMNATYTDVSTTDQVSRSFVVGSTDKKLLFDIDGKQVSIILKDRIAFAPDNTTEYGKLLVDFTIMGKYFHEKLSKIFLK